MENKIRLRVLILIGWGILGLVNPVLAVPDVSSVSGIVVHGQNITVSGSAFGVKSPAAPVYWNDYEMTTIDDPSVTQGEGGFAAIWSPIEACASMNLYGDPRPMFKNASSVRWPGAPHARSTKLIGGGFTDASYYFQDDPCVNVTVMVCAPEGSKRWFVDYYKRYSADWITPPAAGQSMVGRDIPVYEINLSQAVDSSETVFNVSGTHIIKLFAGDVLRIDNEKVQVTSNNGSTLDVVRGHLGTTPASHSAGRMYIRGVDYNLKEGTAQIVSSPYSSQHWQNGGGTIKQEGSSNFSFLPSGEGGGMHSCTGCAANTNRIYVTGEDSRQGWRNLEFALKDDAPGNLKAYIDNKKTFDCTCSDQGQEYQGWTAPGAVGGTFLTEDIICMGFGAYSPRIFIPEGTTDDGAHRHQPDESWIYLDDIYADTSLARVVLADNANYDLATITEPQIPSAWDDGSLTATVNLGKLPDSGTAYLFVFDVDNNHNVTGYPVTLGGGADTTPPSAPSGLSVI